MRSGLCGFHNLNQALRRQCRPHTNGAVSYTYTYLHLRTSVGYSTNWNAVGRRGVSQSILSDKRQVKGSQCRQGDGEEGVKGERSEKDKGEKEILIHRHMGHKHVVSSCGTLRIAPLFTFSCWRAEHQLIYFSQNGPNGNGVAA